jgi:hypothetical protein
MLEAEVLHRMLLAAPRSDYNALDQTPTRVLRPRFYIGSGR